MKEMYDVAIIGGGVAGLTAAIYSVRNTLETVVFEKPGRLGGQIVTAPAIENYPGIPGISGYELIQKLMDQALALGITILYEPVSNIEISTEAKCIYTPKGNYSAKAIIAAGGCTTRPIGCDNEQAFVGRGVSYCATCDGNFFRGKPVCVVGGGNTALEDALFLSNICETVYLIHRRDEFRGSLKNVRALEKKNNVKFVLDSVVTAINGDKKVESVQIRNVKNDEESSLEVSGIFVAIGQVPQTELYKDIVKLDSYGYIVADESCATSAEGIFVAGDIRTKQLRQLVTAAADGAVAAVAAADFIIRQ